MASSSSCSRIAAAFVALMAMMSVASGFKAKSFNYTESEYYEQWMPAMATWYGQPNGAGPDDDGGACGFKNVNQPPFSSMTSCGNAFLFKGGKGCGSCYKIRCRQHPACSGQPEKIVITDLNADIVNQQVQVHFDLSGTAFGALAKYGLNDELRHAGIMQIEFMRIPCEYPGRNIMFHVEEGSNPVYFAVLVEYADRDGDIFQVDMMETPRHGPRQWTPMRESWGSIWRYDSNHVLEAPFSLRITSESGRTLIANDVIPANWMPNTVYRSYVQYN